MLHGQSLTSDKDRRGAAHQGVEGLEDGAQVTSEARGRAGDTDAGFLDLLLASGMSDEFKDMANDLEGCS
jgi:hypothetical protein